MRTAKQLLITVAVLLCSTVASAHDFEVGGIYYNITSSNDLTVEVTHIGKNPSAYKAYSDEVVIPSTVIYNSKTYVVTGITGSAFYKCDGLTSVTIPNSITSIGSLAFMDCTGLTSIKIPSSVTNIENGAFSFCTGLTSVTICNGVTTIGGFMFEGCTSLKSIKIPSSVTNIGNLAFSRCTSLTSVTIGNGVTNIGHDAFRDCQNLTSITIPNSVTTLEYGAFAGCKGLTNITIGNGITNIESQIFSNCTSLTSIEIPSSITTIEYGAFYNNPGLTSIYLLGKTPPTVVSGNFTEKHYANITLYVPAGTLETYRNADTWKNFLNIQEVAAPGTPGVGTKKCATPVISYNNCGLDITCNTDEAEIHTTIKCSDANSYNSGRIDLSATYEITTYATLAGYEDSEIATATLCWVEKESDSTDIIEVIGNPVLICTNNGSIVVKGAEAGTEIAVYNINGTMQGTATANGSEVVINTSLGKGDIAIINIGSKAIKVVMQ